MGTVTASLQTVTSLQISEMIPQTLSVFGALTGLTLEPKTNQTSVHCYNDHDLSISLTEVWTCDLENLESGGCLDCAGNQFKEGDSILVCGGCMKHTCQSFDCEDPIKGELTQVRKYFWSPAIVSPSCCTDWRGRVVPPGTEIGCRLLGDKCKTRECLSCKTRPEDNQGYIHSNYWATDCCLDHTGVHQVGERSRDAAVCSNKKCVRGHPAYWTQEQYYGTFHCCEWGDRILSPGQTIHYDGQCLTYSGGQIRRCTTDQVVSIGFIIDPSPVSIISRLVHTVIERLRATLKVLSWGLNDLSHPGLITQTTKDIQHFLQLLAGIDYTSLPQLPGNPNVTLGLLDALHTLPHGSAIIIFIKSSTDQLQLETEINRLIKENDIQIFIILSPEFHDTDNGLSLNFYHNIAIRVIDLRAVDHSNNDWIDVFIQIIIKRCAPIPPPTTVAPPVDGGWSDWSEFLTCSKTCGTGIQHRHRECNNPPPSNGGAACVGLSTSSRACSIRPCPKDGGWSIWSSFTSCSKTCDTGVKFRSRQCNNPAPKHGGEHCVGNSTQSVACNTHPCPGDGNWGEWSQFTVCSKTCGTGVHSRYRECNNPPPKHGGAQCAGPSTESKSCNIQPCAVDGGWSQWSNFTTCTKTCGTGIQYRYRKCNNPIPIHGGAQCVGESYSAQKCNTNPCICDIKSVSTVWIDDIFGSRQPGDPLTEDQDSEFTCWNPKAENPNNAILSSIPGNGHHTPKNAYEFSSSDVSVFTNPIDFTLVYHKSGGKNSIWKAVCPFGYKTLGHWCQKGITKPDIRMSLKCVKDTCVTPCPTEPIFNWVDEFLSVYRSSDPKVLGLAIAVGHDAPAPQQALCLRYGSYGSNDQL